MDCEGAGRLLHPLADRELGLERSLDVEAHIDGCPACGRTYRNLLDLKAKLRADLPYEPAPDRLRNRLQTVSIGGHATKPIAPRPDFRRFLTLSLLPAAAALIFLAFVVANNQIQTPRSTADRIADEALSGHLRSLMANHLADVMSTDQHTVKPYFAGRLDFSPPVLDLAKAGFPLIAGRLDYMDGRPVAAIVYRRNRHIINLFIWPNATQVESRPINLSRRGYQMVHWSSSGMTEWAVSDLNAGELDEFAADLRRGR